jgi:hypothetical protein
MLWFSKCQFSLECILPNICRCLFGQLLYFEQEENGGLGLALQEDSVKCGRATCAGMYFLHFQVYKLDPTVNAVCIVI